MTLQINNSRNNMLPNNVFILTAKVLKTANIGDPTHKLTCNNKSDEYFCK